MNEKKYWNKKRGKHQLKNPIIRKNWKSLCKKNHIDDYEAIWDDSLSYKENVKDMIDNVQNIIPDMW